MKYNVNCAISISIKMYNIIHWAEKIIINNQASSNEDQDEKYLDKKLL